jgi:hypothetical protein
MQGVRDETRRQGQEDHHEKDEQVEAQEEVIGPGELVGQGGRCAGAMRRRWSGS